MFKKRDSLSKNQLCVEIRELIATTPAAELNKLHEEFLEFTRDVERRMPVPYDYNKIQTRLEHELDFAVARGVNYADLPLYDIHALLKLISTGQ